MFDAGGCETLEPEKSSSIPRRSTTGVGSGALAVAAGFVFDRTGVLVDLVGVDKEFDRRAATTSSSPASYSSNLLEVESLKPPLLPPPE